MKVKNIFSLAFAIIIIQLIIVLALIGGGIWGISILVCDIKEHGLKGVISSVWNGPTNQTAVVEQK